MQSQWSTEYGRGCGFMGYIGGCDVISENPVISICEFGDIIKIAIDKSHVSLKYIPYYLEVSNYKQIFTTSDS
jgi:hypothetical protein